jgi:hypothetical protein
MRIAFDLDGTVWGNEIIFRDLIQSLKDSGNFIAILTAHVNLEKKDLDLWNRRGLPAVDFYISKVDGEQHIPSREWKILTARAHKFDILFDNFDGDDIIFTIISNEY